MYTADTLTCSHCNEPSKNVLIPGTHSDKLVVEKRKTQSVVFTFSCPWGNLYVVIFQHTIDYW